MDNNLPNFPSGKAVLFNGPGLPFEFVERALPAIHPNELLVKNLYTTLCGSDIHTYCGHRKEPDHVVLGHEIVGDILWLGSEHPAKDFRGEPVQIGDRITWSIFAVPPGIEAPREDMPQKSDQLFKYGHALSTGNDVFTGGLADYCVLRPNTAFIKISGDIPLKVAATISCAHATVAGALRVAGNTKGKKILIFGAGLLGLSCVAMCKEAGAGWIGLVDTEASRLRWGSQFGADKTYDFVNEHSSWPEADIVFDMTGSAVAMKAGIDALALGGCAVWIGAVFPAKPVPVDAQQIVRRVLTIKGLHNYNYHDFVNATVFIEQCHTRYPFEALVEQEYPLSEVEEAFRFANESKPVRVGIQIDSITM